MCLFNVLSVVLLIKLYSRQNIYTDIYIYIYKLNELYTNITCYYTVVRWKIILK